MLNNIKIIVTVLIIILINSCNNKNDNVIAYIPFSLDSINITSNSIYLDSAVSIELFINNQSKKDTFWIPISQWEMDAIFQKNGWLPNGMPLNNYIVNNFILHPKDSLMHTMYEKASGPTFNNFPKLWQIEPKSKKYINIKFKLNELLELNTIFEILSNIPLTNRENLTNLLKQIPFTMDSSIYFNADSLKLSFNSISGVKRPWIDDSSSNIRLDSIYNKKLIELIDKESIRMAKSLSKELNISYLDEDDYQRWLKYEISNANKKLAEECLRDFYSYKIINAFKQSLRSDCVIKSN